MAEVHLLVVVDTDTGLARLTDLSEAPVDSRASAWDGDEWRWPTEQELEALDVASVKIHAAMTVFGLHQ